jgi:uncharacterized protein (DUF4415 family)
MLSHLHKINWIRWSQSVLCEGAQSYQKKKQLVSIRYSPEVLAYFKASGAGWKVRMDAVLKEYIEKHPSGDAKEA